MVPNDINDPPSINIHYFLKLTAGLVTFGHLLAEV